MARLGNFGEKRMLYSLNGRNSCGYSGEKGHEIWPVEKTIRDVTSRGLGSHWLNPRKVPAGTVIPLMIGSKDIRNGRSLEDTKAELHAFLQEFWKLNLKAVVLLTTVLVYGNPEGRGHEFWPKQKKIIRWNAYLTAIATYYSTIENRPIVKVHLTSPQQERTKLNVYTPSPLGYDRIAYDFFVGILQALERGFFQDPIFNPRTFEETFGANQKTYDRTEIKDDVIRKFNCHQPRGRESPSTGDIPKSLYRSANDKIDFAHSRACNATFNCKFSWDDGDPKLGADRELTCVMAGGDGPRHTTHHEVLVQKREDDQELGDWCVLAVSGLIETCIVKEGKYGGYWTDGKGRFVNISNTAWHPYMLDGNPDDDHPQEPSYNSKPNWDSEYIPFEKAMEMIKQE